VYFGAIFGSFTLLAFAAARGAIPLGKRVGMRRLTIVAMVLMAAGLGVLAAARSLPLSIAGMGLVGIASGGVRPLTLSSLSSENLSAAEHKRALSIMERRTGVLSAAVILLGGVLLGLAILPFGNLMSITVVCYVAGVAALFLLRRETRGRASTVPIVPAALLRHASAGGVSPRQGALLGKGEADQHG
jgi:MFS family permease